MTGEQFVAVMGIGFAAFAVWLVVQIVNRERWAIPIAVGLVVCILIIVATIFVHIWTMRDV
jgi:hypothetical protein